MRRVIAVILAGLFLAPAAPARSAERREQSTRVVDAAGLKGLRVDNPGGRIAIGPSADGRIHLTALKIVRGSGARAERFARETEVRTSTERGTYTVQVRYPRRQAIRVGLGEILSGVDPPRVEVRLGLEIPPLMPVRLESASGDLAVEKVRGPQDLETVSGDIELRSLGGPVRVSCVSGDVEAEDIERLRIDTVSGDVRVRRARGPVWIRGTSGDVDAGGCADSLWIESQSGDIEADAAPRGVEARSTSGSIRIQGAAGRVALSSSAGDVVVDLVKPLRSASVSTTSGDIGLRLAPDLACALELRTRSGSLAIDVPLKPGQVTRNAVTGTVRGGRTPVTLESTSGDIHVGGGP